MAQLPTGIATFLFTDIEGSTSMLQRLGSAYVELLEQHDAIVRARSIANGGVEVGNEGDAFFMVFATAQGCVTAAVGIQAALHDHEWPDGGAIRVRMGIHTGRAELGGTNYVGLDVNLAARIGAAGHGGQILASRATVEAASDVLGEGAVVVDLGDHRFKDLEVPAHVYQITPAGLPADFPPIRSLTTRPNNLPAATSEFIGRSVESERLSEMLGSHRLVTLVGPGGTGKTRLALSVAGRLLSRYEDGVAYVPLESITDPDHIASEVAAACGIDVVDSDPAETMVTALRRRRILILLDNFEHLLDGRGLVTRILEAAPDVTILVTSRSTLRIGGEHVFEVPPLGRNDAIDLFVARATAVDPSLTVDDRQRGQIAGIVDRLELLPLAIELAAARVTLFGVSGLEERLADRFGTLTGRDRQVPDRHRTLRDTIAWSHELLDTSTRAAMAELSVFAGGFTLDGAEAVVAPDHQPLESVANLLDGSLLRRTVASGETRFSMLDSIREFATGELKASGTTDVVRDRHARYFAELAASARDLLEGEAQMVWLQRLTDEHDNLRAVARYSLDGGDVDPGLVAVGASWRFWHRRGHLIEARDLLTRLLDVPGASDQARLEGLNGLAAVEYWLGDYTAAAETYSRVLEVALRTGDVRRLAETYFGLGTTLAYLDRLDEAIAYSDKAGEAYRESGDEDGMRRVTAAKAFTTWQSGRLEASVELWKEASRLYAAAGDRAESIQSDTAGAIVTHLLGNTTEAIGALLTALEGMLEIEDIAGITMAIDVLGAVVATRDPAAGVRLEAAASHLREGLGGGLTPAAVGLSTARSVASESLTESAVGDAWAEGASLDLDAAVDLARSIRV